jgi:sulfide dehydrogenase cytochrome subunit
MKYLPIGAGLFVALVLAGPSQATPTAAMLGNPCVTCHGANGASIGAIPSLQGYPKEVIISALDAFRADSRPATIMGRIAKGYTDEEIEALGEFFSRIPDVRP